MTIIARSTGNATVTISARYRPNVNVSLRRRDVYCL